MAETARRMLGAMSGSAALARRLPGGQSPASRRVGLIVYPQVRRSNNSEPAPQRMSMTGRRSTRPHGALDQGQLLNRSGGRTAAGGLAERRKRTEHECQSEDARHHRAEAEDHRLRCRRGRLQRGQQHDRGGSQGVEFVVANTDAQALTMTKADRLIQMGVAVTQGLGRRLAAGDRPRRAEETIDEINDHLAGSHMAFITAGMGGGTGTGAAPIVARAARESGILTVGVVTKPFQFEGQRRMRLAEAGIQELQKHVDTLIVIPNQNLFRIANDKTTFADAFAMADEVLYSASPASPT
jgi:hypothetical protein